jgi:2'-5' RNA ligase superfamily
VGNALPETALICRVPEAEPYIGKYRERFDPPARRNVPAHVTVLYPFMPPGDVDEAVIAQLSAAARSIPSFAYRLAETRRFSIGSLYLAPDPGTSFSMLTDAVHRAFPDYPPFGGKFVTVAHGDPQTLGEIDIALRIALPPAGIAAHCDEVLLIENTTKVWLTMQTFALGAAR